MAGSLSRRHFLAGSTAATALTVAGGEAMAALEPKKYSPNDTIRFAAIGHGIMGNKDVATAMKVPGTELVAICDLYQGRLEAAREKYAPSVTTVKDYSTLLDRPDIDAVIIATCDKWHAPIAKAAMEKGKAVYCEKPVVREIAEGADVLAVQRKTGAIMQVGSQWVSSAAFLQARDKYRSGAIGQLNCIAASYDRQSALGAWEYTMPTDASEQTVDWARYTAGDPPSNFDKKKFFWWRNYREFGTGVAGDLFVHLISGVHLVLGSKGPTRIFASGELAYWKDGRNVPDVMTAIMEYPETPEHPAFQLTLRVDFASGNGEQASTKFVGSEGILDMSWRGFTVSPNPMPKAPGIGGWDALDTYPKAMQKQLLAEYHQKYSTADEKAPSRPASSFQLPESYNEHLVHFTNFFDAMRGTAKLNEDATFGFRAAAPALACNQSYFEKRIIDWDPQNMRL